MTSDDIIMSLSGKHLAGDVRREIETMAFDLSSSKKMVDLLPRHRELITDHTRCCGVLSRAPLRQGLFHNQTPPERASPTLLAALRAEAGTMDVARPSATLVSSGFGTSATVRTSTNTTSSGAVLKEDTEAICTQGTQKVLTPR